MTVAASSMGLVLFFGTVAALPLPQRPAGLPATYRPATGGPLPAATSDNVQKRGNCKSCFVLGGEPYSRTGSSRSSSESYYPTHHPTREHDLHSTPSVHGLPVNAPPRSPSYHIDTSSENSPSWQPSHAVAPPAQVSPARTHNSEESHHGYWEMTPSPPTSAEGTPRRLDPKFSNAAGSLAVTPGPWGHSPGHDPTSPKAYSAANGFPVGAPGPESPPHGSHSTSPASSRSSQVTASPPPSPHSPAQWSPRSSEDGSLDHERAAKDTSKPLQKRGLCKSCLRPPSTEQSAAAHYPARHLPRPATQGRPQRVATPDPALQWRPPPASATYPHDPEGITTELPLQAARPIRPARPQPQREGNDGAGPSRVNNDDEGEPVSPHMWSAMNGFENKAEPKKIETPPQWSPATTPGSLSPPGSPAKIKRAIPLDANERLDSQGTADTNFNTRHDTSDALHKRGGCVSCLKPHGAAPHGAAPHGALPAGAVPHQAVPAPATPPSVPGSPNHPPAAPATPAPQPVPQTQGADRVARMQELRQQLDAGATLGRGRGAYPPNVAQFVPDGASTSRTPAIDPTRLGGIQRPPGAPTPENPHAFSAAHGYVSDEDTRRVMSPPYDSSSGGSSPSRMSSPYGSARHDFDFPHRRSLGSATPLGQAVSHAPSPSKRLVQAQNADLLAPRERLG